MLHQPGVVRVGHLELVEAAHVAVAEHRADAARQAARIAQAPSDRGVQPGEQVGPVQAAYAVLAAGDHAVEQPGPTAPRRPVQVDAVRAGPAEVAQRREHRGLRGTEPEALVARAGGEPVGPGHGRNASQGPALDPHQPPPGRPTPPDTAEAPPGLPGRASDLHCSLSG